MELRLLNYFLMTAREENITRAAKILHVTQPTLSRQLMQLEEELGTKFFERGKYHITLTADGMLLKRRAQDILTLTDKTVKELTCMSTDISGEIGISSSGIISMRFLSELLVQFQQQYPAVHYEIYSGNADTTKIHMENGLVDIGLLLEPVDIMQYEFIRMPEQERWGALGCKDSVLVSKTELRPGDLLGFPLMLPKRAAIRNEIMNWFGEMASQMNVVVNYHLMYNTAMLVKEGMGIALCPESENLYKDLCFVPFKPDLKLTSVLAWKKHQVFSPATMAFIEYIKQYVQQREIQ